MNKTLKLIAALSLAASLAGCSSDKAPADSGNNETETNTETSAVNPHGYQIVPLEAAQLPLSLPDLDAGVINGNYALEAKLNETSPAVAIEEFDAETSIRRTNYLVVKEGNEESEKTQALIAAITSSDVSTYIENTYKGAVITSFIDEEGNPISGGDIPDATGDDTKITVGATAVPHAQILNDVLKDTLLKHGWELEVVEYTDYVQPNTALDAGDLDANYFQTLGYMHNENKERGLHLAAAVGVHIEPMGVYSAKAKSLSELPDGAEIGVPNDTDNYGRAIELLNTLGLLNGAPVDPEAIKEING